VSGFVTEIGEAFVGTGAEAAHLNTVLGAKGGPVETAWVTALATPRAGHAAFLTTLRPGVPARPMTLFVNKATLEGEGHSAMTWGPAQAGVASGVLWAVADGIVDAGQVDDLVLIAAGFTGPELDRLGLHAPQNMTARATLQVDENWRVASVPGASPVFACGDAVRGQSLIVWAIAEGRSAAAAIDTALRGSTELPAPLSPYAVSW